LYLKEYINDARSHERQNYGTIRFLQYMFSVLLSDDEHRLPKHVVGIQENTKTCTTLWYILQGKVFSALIVKSL